MNPLPEQWKQLTANTSAKDLILVDGAVQHAIGSRLQSEKFDALCFFDREPGEARGLGPWLLEPETAHQLGIDGIARGITWLSTELSLRDAYGQLKPWVVQPFPDGVKRGYLRIGDGRTLRSLLDKIWTPLQKRAFCTPWKVICLADRDGQGRLLICSGQTARIGSVAHRLSALQYQALLDASVPDQLLHELKPHVRPHAKLASRELRYRMATSIIEQATELAYTDPYDQMILIGWALRYGKVADNSLKYLQVIRDGLHGQQLWHSLMADEEKGRLMTGALSDFLSEEELRE